VKADLIPTSVQRPIDRLDRYIGDGEKPLDKLFESAQEKCVSAIRKQLEEVQDFDFSDWVSYSNHPKAREWRSLCKNTG